MVWPTLQQVRAIVFDFDGVFTDNAVYVFEDGREAVRCDRGDGLGIELLQLVRERDGLDCRLLVLSKERNSVVQARADKLGITCIHGAHDKLETVIRYFQEVAPARDLLASTVFLGNDINDLPVIRRCLFSVVPADAHPIVKKFASAVLPQRGGHGFVRAAIEQLLGVDQWPVEQVEAFFVTAGVS